MKKIGIIGILILALSSCDMLIKDPLSQLSVEKTFQTFEGADAATRGCYSFLSGSGYYLMDRWVFACEGTDISSNGGATADYQWTSGEGRWNDWWLATYQAIGACNTCIQQLGNSPISTSQKELLDGECRFLRALYYYHALTYWGGVPLVTKQLSSLDDIRDITRKSAKEISDFIVSELGLAIKVLPASQKSPSRATKGAAMTLLAKVYMMNKEWTLAAKTCKDIVDLKKYDLFKDYGDVFTQLQKNGIEHIFSVQFSTDKPSTSSKMLWYLGPGKDEWDKFNGLGGSGVPRSFYKLYDEWDLRLAHNLADSWRGQPFRDGRIVCLKYWDRKVPQIIDYDGQNFPMFRYADILLMYAEALNEENNGPVELAYTMLNDVRERAGLDPVERLSYTKFQKLIRDERAKELCFEGHRRFDLIRWGILVETVKKVSREIGSKGEEYVSEAHHLCPIPDAERLKNPKIEQNPGYN